MILKSKWRDLNSRLGGRGIYVSEIYFSNFWKIKKKKTEVTLSLILRFNLRLGGTPYGVQVLRAPYMIKISRLENLTASKQMEVLEGLLDVSEGRTRRMF